MDNLKDIEIDDIYSAIDEYIHTVVYFWAPSCGLCRYIGPIFDSLAKEYPDVLFCKINTKENTDSYTMLGIKGVPTIKFYEDGTTIDTIVGCKDYNSMKQIYKDKIEDLING